MKRGLDTQINTRAPKISEGLFLDVDNISVTFPSILVPSGTAPIEADKKVLRGNNGKIIGVRALDRISFRLEEGDRLAIIGRNGSGKTTLLQTLAGILAPDAGQIVFRGRATSLININLGIQPDATGHRNITLRGLAAGYSKAQIEDKRAAIEAFCELGAFLDMPMETYSAGMKMRLTFAIATAFDPEILILDEWLSAGDVVFKRKATERMREFVGKAGILVLASHSHNLLLNNCNKALWLESGQIKMLAETAEVIDAYEAAQKPE